MLLDLLPLEQAATKQTGFGGDAAEGTIQPSWQTTVHGVAHQRWTCLETAYGTATATCAASGAARAAGTATAARTARAALTTRQTATATTRPDTGRAVTVNIRRLAAVTTAALIDQGEPLWT